MLVLFGVLLSVFLSSSQETEITCNDYMCLGTRIYCINSDRSSATIRCFELGPSGLQKKYQFDSDHIKPVAAHETDKYLYLSLIHI